MADAARLRALAIANPDAARKLLAELESKTLIPHDGGQKDVLAATERFMILNAGRRWGKTKVGARRVIMEARKKNQMIWWVAPTYKVVKRGYAEVVRQLPEGVLAKPAPSEAAFDAGRAVILRLKNGTRIEFYSAERPEGMLGEGVDFAVLDEAAIMPETIWTQIIRPTLADRQGSALMISTPRGRNWFWREWNRGQDNEYPDYKSWRFPSMSNPTIPPEEWEQMSETMPRAVYEQEVLADFISKAAAVFRFDEEAIQPLHPPKGHVVLGIDLAKHRDFTVIDGARMNDRLPCYHERFNAVSWPEQKERIRAAINRMRRQGATHVTIVMDSTGIGDVVYDDLSLEGYDIVGIKFTQQWKQASVQLLAADLERGAAYIHADQRNEFEAYGYTITNAGRWTFAAPDGGHDDEVSAKLLQHWGLVHEGSPDIRLLNLHEPSTPADDYDYGEGDWADDPIDEIHPEVVEARTPWEMMQDPAVWR